MKNEALISSLRERDISVKGVFGTKTPDGQQVGNEYLDPEPATQQTAYFNKRKGPGHKTFKESELRDKAIKWACQNKAEQFFRTTPGLLKNLRWDDSDEDREIWAEKLVSYATWGGHGRSEGSDHWYNTILKSCEEECEVN